MPIADQEWLSSQVVEMSYHLASAGSGLDYARMAIEAPMLFHERYYIGCIAPSIKTWLQNSTPKNNKPSTNTNIPISSSPAATDKMPLNDDVRNLTPTALCLTGPIGQMAYTGLMSVDWELLGEVNFNGVFGVIP